MKWLRFTIRFVWIVFKRLIKVLRIFKIVHCFILLLSEMYDYDHEYLSYQQELEDYHIHLLFLITVHPEMFRHLPRRNFGYLNLKENIQ